MTISLFKRTDRYDIVGVASYPMNIGERISVLPGIGIAVAMGYALPSVADEVLALIANGWTVGAALDEAMNHPDSQYSQLIVATRMGSGARTGPASTASAAHDDNDPNLLVAANCMKTDQVWQQALEELLACNDADPFRQMQLALEKARALGGDRRGMHSASIVVIDKHSWNITVADVNFDELDPIAKLPFAERQPWHNRLPLDPRLNELNAADYALIDALSDPSNSKTVAKYRETVEAISPKIVRAFEQEIAYHEVALRCFEGAPISEIHQAFWYLKKEYPDLWLYGVEGGIGTGVFREILKPFKPPRVQMFNPYYGIPEAFVNVHETPDEACLTL